MGRLFLFIRYREKYSKLILDLLHICTDQFNQLYIDHLQIANFIIPSENPPTTSSRANEVSRGNCVTRWLNYYCYINKRTKNNRRKHKCENNEDNSVISYQYHTSTGSLWEGDVFLVYNYRKRDI